MRSYVFPFAIVLACLLACSFLVGAKEIENPYTGVTITSTDATVISRLDIKSSQPQIEFWNNTNATTHYIITFVNTFETASTTQVMAINASIYVPDDWTLTQDDPNGAVTFTSTEGKYLYPNMDPLRRDPPAPFKNLTFVNYVNMMTGTTKQNNRMNYKAGKFNIIMDQYNFTNVNTNSEEGAAVLTFQLNQTYNGQTMNMPITADQSLNLQFGGGYFAVNNSANSGGNDYSVSIAPAVKDFNFTNQTYINNGIEGYWVDNCQDAYIYFDSFPNGTITLDPEYGFGQGIQTPGHLVTIVVASVVGGVILVVAVLAGIFIIRRKNQSKKNYQKF